MFKVNKKFDNELLKRYDIEAELTYDKVTPSNNDVAVMVAKDVGVDVSLVVVKKIDNDYGKRFALVEAVAYKNKEDMDATEKRGKKLIEKEKKAEEAKKKAGEAKKKKVEEAKVTPPVEEKPVEEKKEEVPVAEKKEAPAEEKAKTPKEGE